MSDLLRKLCRCADFGNAVDCAREKHVKAFDDYTRSLEMEEADNFGWEDACDCDCHRHEGDYDDYDWELEALKDTK